MQESVTACALESSGQYVHEYLPQKLSSWQCAALVLFCRRAQLECLKVFVLLLVKALFFFGGHEVLLSCKVSAKESGCIDLYILVGSTFHIPG